jgi:putative DNA primase/helicase
LDYPGGLDHERISEILHQNYATWESLLPYIVAWDWGQQYELIPDLPEDTRETDVGNAARLVYWYGDTLLFCYPWGKWLVWDGRRWRPDDTGGVTRLAKDTVRRIYAESSSHSNRKRRGELAKWAIRSESKERIKSMIELAKSEVPVLPDRLDADPWLLTVANGTLDLRSGELLAHDPGLFSTKLVEVEYDPAADCPLWLQFLDEILAGDDGTIRFLQRAIGYSLTGDTGERCLFVLHGGGANGKTTFLEVCRALLGDYAQRVPTETLLASKRSAGAASPDIARLKGARFVSASESEEGRRLAEAVIKDLTGGDTVTARFLYGRGFDFKPECKLWLATNHKPTIRGTDKAIWDRIRLVPFDVTIPENKQDKHLADKLKEELPGILAWAVQGCLDWQREGLSVTEKVRAATSAYRDEMDLLGGFIEDCCIEGADKEALAGDLYGAYRAWGGDLGQRKFGLALRERGYKKGRHSSGRITWGGLGLISRTLNLTEPDFSKIKAVQNPLGTLQEKGSQGSQGSGSYADDALVRAAEDLGGEVVKVETVNGTVALPF